MFSVLSHALTTLFRCYKQYSLSRSPSSAIVVHLAKQVYVAGQLFRRILHLILQLLGLRLAPPFGESGPYHLKANRLIVGPNHCKGVSNGGHNGITVEALEVLPCRLTPVDEGVWTRWPTVGLRSHLQVNAVEHRLDTGNYGVELAPLGPGLLL